MTTINVKAAELRTKLWTMANEFKLLAQTAGGSDEAQQQIDEVGCRLADIYENLGDVFIDAHRDAACQEYAIAVSE